MKHIITCDKKSILCTFKDEIVSNDIQEVSEKVVQFIGQYSSTKKFNIIFDVTNASAPDFKQFNEAVTFAKPYFEKFNNAYIVGATGIQIFLAKRFFELYSTFSNSQKIYFYTMEEVKEHIEASWIKYCQKNERL